jgi:hypothetical protein
LAFYLHREYVVTKTTDEEIDLIDEEQRSTFLKGTETMKLPKPQVSDIQLANKKAFTLDIPLCVLTAPDFPWLK